MRHSTWVALAGCAALLAGCAELDPISAPKPTGGRANFSVYAAMGTSLTAGFESGGLVDHHQVHGYAALFARQAGSSPFTLPTISANGIPPLLRIVSLSPLIISNAGRTTGSPTNFAQPTAYHDMGVPGAILADCADSTLYYGGLPGRPSTMFDLIVRHRGTILEQVASLSPTFVSLEYGANEILGPATNGSGTVFPDPASFQGLLHLTLHGVQSAVPNAQIVIFTVPDVPTIPYFTTFPPFTVDVATGAPVPLIGPNGPLTPGDRVLLDAAADMAGGNGFPANGYNYVNPAAPGTGQPLTDAEVLSAAEAAQITSAVNGYNDAIRAEAAIVGAAVVDFHALLQTAATVGLPYQGTLYHAGFLGGLFSLDGVHPTDLGYGFMANAMIDAVNAAFGSSVPKVDLSQAATITASRLGLDTGEEGRRYPVIEGGEAYYREMFPRITVPLAAPVVARR